ncbi:unnamed protein product [Blepharisma stoltei]|uniref:dual-specificity kinase n=1 Tax=Blepharisma stoltei TaxID=1481888 RepID=A0AAU9JVN3_9CILI|nr:unnamed protein product [Blepharisma stoltei]
MSNPKSKARLYFKESLPKNFTPTRPIPPLKLASLKNTSKVISSTTARIKNSADSYNDSQSFPKQTAPTYETKINHHRSSSVIHIMPSLKASISSVSQAVLKGSWNSMSLPISAGMTLQLFRSELTDLEQSEILSFPKVFFIGFGVEKLKPDRDPQHNFGFDDERSDYILVKGDHIAYRYEIIQILGKGSFGQVIKAYDHKEKEEIALKIIRNKQKFHNQANIEVQVLKVLRDNDSGDSGVVHLREYFLFRNHLCITFELLSINLYHYLKINSFKGMSLGVIRNLAHQLLTAIKLIHGLNIIHCDLKPENILLRNLNDTLIKIIDFGSACFEHQRLYSYIQSRYYRAPEVILGLGYSKAIDMWSLGCILVELYTGNPLFPGDSEQDQLLCFIEHLNAPPQHLINLASKRLLFFDENNEVILVKNHKGKVRMPGTLSLETVLKGADELFIDFIKKCLEWDPTLRITAFQALSHPWLIEPKKIMHRASLSEVRIDKSKPKVHRIKRLRIGQPGKHFKQQSLSSRYNVPYYPSYIV